MTTLNIGLLFSTTGTYQAIGKDALNGVLLGINQVNHNASLALQIEPHIQNPGGSIEQYLAMTDAMLKHSNIQHIFGTITSIARKEVLPIVEKHDAMLWYLCPYEGFECSENVIYYGACPNQHIVPLFEYVLPKYGNKAHLIGTNYIWGWETNRIARELLMACGGEVLSEKYYAFEEFEFSRQISEILEKKPDFILNNLVGSSSYAFLQTLAKAALQYPELSRGKLPVLSCNVTECEIDKIGQAAQGMYTTASYFQDVDSKENQQLQDLAASYFGNPIKISSEFAAGYSSVLMLAEAVCEERSSEPEMVKEYLANHSFNTALGQLTLDPKTNHFPLTPYIARVDQGQPLVIDQNVKQVIADPYLVNFNAHEFAVKIAHGRRKMLGNSFLKVIK
ncbi:MAG: transporter substrate-binding protein [Oceanospirillaceae bacterium]